MTWAKVDDQFFNHPKARAAGKDGRALFVAGLCYVGANESDGKIPKASLGLVAAQAEVRPAPTARKLVDAGLWHDRGDVYMVHHYLDWNPSADELAARRVARSEAGRRGGQRSGSSRRSKREATAEANASANAEADAEQKGSKTEPRSRREQSSSNSGVPPAHNVMFGAVCRAFGDPATPSERANYGKTASELVAAGASPEHVQVCVNRAKALKWEGFTHNVLRNRYSMLMRTPDRSPLQPREVEFCEECGKPMGDCRGHEESA